MKTIINKKVYNTETATLLHKEWNGLSSTDNRNLMEALYQTLNGAYFLHGKGGAMTSYCECIGNSQYEGETIVPMTETEAYEWLESVGAVTAIEKHFQDLLKEA